MIQVPIERLRRMLRYEPETGKLYWRERQPSDFAHTVDPAGYCTAFNSRYAGKEAFTASKSGYKTTTIRGFGRFRAHRVAWAIVHGEWPEQLDHINHDRSDNRLCNLRAANDTLNQRNRPLRKDNKLGRTGVYQTKAGRYSAEITLAGRTKRLGTFDTVEAASAARSAAEAMHGFHPNHGRATC